MHLHIKLVYLIIHFRLCVVVGSDPYSNLSEFIWSVYMILSWAALGPACNEFGYNVQIINARKQSLRRLCFHRCLSVHMGACMGGGMCGRGRAWQGGACMVGTMLCRREGAAWQERRLLQRAVCILLECILFACLHLLSGQHLLIDYKVKKNQLQRAKGFYEHIYVHRTARCKRYHPPPA